MFDKYDKIINSAGFDKSTTAHKSTIYIRLNAFCFPVGSSHVSVRYPLQLVLGLPEALKSCFWCYNELLLTHVFLITIVTSWSSSFVCVLTNGSFSFFFYKWLLLFESFDIYFTLFCVIFLFVIFHFVSCKCIHCKKLSSYDGE